MSEQSMHRNAPSSPEKTLSLKQRQAALLLARGKKIADAAQEVKVHESTIDRWKKDPAFLAAIRQAEDELYNESLRQIKKTAGAAIICLTRNMGEKVSPYVQVQAAGKLLDLGIDIYKLDEVLVGLDDMRRRLDNAG